MKDFDFEYFPQIETERLMMRAVSPRDAHRIFNIFSDEEVMKYYGMYPMESIDEAEKLVYIFQKGFNEQKSLRWALTLKHSGELIGTCGFHNMNRVHRRSEIGYELAKEHWNRGYITESIEAMLEFGFHVMGLNRIEALVYPENGASHKVLDNLGFQVEGLLEEYAYFRDTYQDLVMHALLKKNHRCAVLELGHDGA